MPQTLLQRPNLVTKSALVDQAHKLAKFEIDTVEQYDAAFFEAAAAASTSIKKRLDIPMKQKSRILKHHQKIMATKQQRQASSSSSGPSPQLVAGLRKLYGEGEALELFSLLQSVLEHTNGSGSSLNSIDSNSFEEEEEALGRTATEDGRLSTAYSIEALLASVCGETEEVGSKKLHGLLIVLLSMVTAYPVTESAKSSSNKEQQPDPSKPPSLQVGSLLGILRGQQIDGEDEDANDGSNDKDNPWTLDAQVLKYLGDASARYEERIEIQKERLLAKLEEESSAAKKETPVVVDDEAGAASGVLSPASRKNHSPGETTPQPVATPNAVEVGEQEQAQPASTNMATQEAIEAAAAALSAAVFDSIIAGAAREEENHNDSSSSSESDPESDYDGPGTMGNEDEEDSSSDDSDSDSDDESGSEEDDDDDSAEGPPGLVSRALHQENGGANENIHDGASSSAGEDVELRQALAFSLSSEPLRAALQVETASSEMDETDNTSQSLTMTPGPITPGTETPMSRKNSSPATTEPGEDSPLPTIPPPPKVYPYSTLLHTQIDADHQIDAGSPYYDPAILNRFGTLPSDHVLVYLITFTLESIERQKNRARSVGDSKKRGEWDVPQATVAGGMCASLFPPRSQVVKPLKAAREDPREIGVSLQMLVSLFLLTVERRNDAIENLQTAIAREKQALDGHAKKKDPEDGDFSNSEEGDDPAIALALHYLDEEAESKESLEAKGMHRKAAAAAHDAAAIRESLHRRTRSWKDQLALFSNGTAMIMQCLQGFLRSLVRNWLEDRQCVSVSDCASLLPKSLIVKLMETVENLIFSTVSNSLDSAVNIEDEDPDSVLSLKIYQSATLLWGEVIPIVFPTVGMQQELVFKYLARCEKYSSDLQFRVLEKMTSPPLSGGEADFHLLGVLCRRLRVGDLLDQLVSRPVCFIPEDGDTTDDSNADQIDVPQRSSSLLSSIAKMTRKFNVLLPELQNLYLALCHRYHIRILLWDGLYASSDTESEESSASLAVASADSMRVATQPSDALVLDSTKCSDSMSIVPNTGESVTGSSANQRASKVWGTVFSSTSFSPKSGIQRWAVRLDKCERGHVFIGVSTAQASTKTYVGGDKYGWGMIGTQALWHDRRKIRGDYGATFRTGSTIIVTLDTDAGTLSFSAWKESSSSGSFPLEATAAPRHVHALGSIEHWGVAFEGLPLDSRLYPAVGLYQRDDQVSLLTVECGSGSEGQNGHLGMPAGQIYYPRMSDFDTPFVESSQVTRARNFNDRLSWEGIEYAVSTLNEILGSLRQGTDTPLVSTLLPSLAASLCLAPATIPVLSQRFSLRLLSFLTQYLPELEELAVDSQSTLFSNGLREGQWVIRATGNSGADPEEYVVDVDPVTTSDGVLSGFAGSGVGTTGKSKNGLVSILGTIKGSSIHFVEEWSEDQGDSSFGVLSTNDLSSICVATVRLGLDGRRFEGHYRNIQFGTSGQIAGMLQADDRKVSKFRLKEAPSHGNFDDDSIADMYMGKSLLGLAHSHLASTLYEEISPELVVDSKNRNFEATTQKGSAYRRREVRNYMKASFLSNCCRFENVNQLPLHMSALQRLYSPPNGARDVIPAKDPFDSSILQELLVDPHYSQVVNDQLKLDHLLMTISEIDTEINSTAGGTGSLSILSKVEYGSARKHIIAALAHICCVPISDCLSVKDVSSLWAGAQKIMESGVRFALSQGPQGLSTREKARRICRLYEEAAKVLLSLKFPVPSAQIEPAVMIDKASSFFRVLETDLDLEVITEEFDKSTKRGILRLVSLTETMSLLKGEVSKTKALCTSGLEAVLSGLPRLLGRNIRPYKLSSQTERVESSTIEGIGDHYLCDLAGAAVGVSASLGAVARFMWGYLSRLLSELVEARKEDSSCHKVTIDSTVLVVVASLSTAMNKDDTAFVLKETKLLSIASHAMDLYRDSPLDMGFLSSSTKYSSVVQELDHMGSKDLRKSVFRSVLGMSHILVYQAICHVPEEYEHMAKVLAFAWAELQKSLPAVQQSVQTFTSAESRKVGEQQWNLWLEDKTRDGFSRTPNSRIDRTKRETGRSGIEYLRENGMMHLALSQGSFSKSHGRNRGSPGKSNKSKITSTLSQQCFSHQILSQWLHVVVAVSKSAAVKLLISNNDERMQLLFSLVGVRDSLDAYKIPGRYRARAIRALFAFLECQPSSDSVVNDLFQLAGRSASTSQSDEASASDVSREVISLLRRLHSPRLPSWRASINEMISSLDTDACSSDSKLGVVLFLNGGVGSIRQGSFVLLKPPAAGALAAEHLPAAAGKSVPSNSGTSSSLLPHHVAGNGTEAIISGLCRADASAGIVSSVDVKNRLCEVVLVNRDPQKPHQTIRKKAGNLQGTFKHSLTVRAVRVPMAEVAQAQEVGLLLGEDTNYSEVLVALMEDALGIQAECLRRLTVFLKGHSSDEKVDLANFHTEISQSAYSAAVLKGAISALSNGSSLDQFLQHTASKRLLSRILQIQNSMDSFLPADGSNSPIQPSSMSLLAEHEARLDFLTELMQNLRGRSQSLDEPIDWITKFQHYKTLVQEGDSEQNDQRSSLGGYKRPDSEHEADAATPLSSTENAASRLESNTNSRDHDNNRTSESSDRRSLSQTINTSDISDDESEGASAAASQLREAAIAHMAELGLPRSWSELALKRTGGVNIEAAVHFCLERGGEMERLLLEEREHERASQRVMGSSARRRGTQHESSGHLLRQLMEMGFPSRWCAEALAATGNNVDEALTWILSNGERLSAEDAGMDDGDDVDNDIDDDDDDDDEDDDEYIGDCISGEDEDHQCSEPSQKVTDDTGKTTGLSQAWSGSVVPIRFISGRSIIDPKTLSVSGLPTGGFSSVGTKGVLLTSGKWYYEAILETAGCLQIGWADGSFAGHCHADRGDGCGDGPSSWAYDGWRRYRWHSTATEWGCRWKEGDVVGCMVDMDEKIMSFTLNGQGEEIGMGVAFSGSGFRPCGGVYACVSFNRKEKLRMILGGRGSEPFKYPPPHGYSGVGEAVLAAVEERNILISREQILDSITASEDELLAGSPAEKLFLCDFSDGEHGHELMAWAHRYYGSDASVHLGAPRNKNSVVYSKKVSTTSGHDLSPVQFLDKTVQDAWQKADETSLNSPIEDELMLVERLRAGYHDVARTINMQAMSESVQLALLYARKLVLHVMVVKGESFDPDCCCDSNDSELKSIHRLWTLIEAAASLRSAGWTGEAGSMAVAAEALGLGISSSGGQNIRHGNLRSISTPFKEFDEYEVPSGGIVQVLSPALRTKSAESEVQCLSRQFVASAEASIGSNSGGGVAVFLLTSLTSAMRRSNRLRDIALASVRRWVRLLSSVEYDGEDAPDKSSEGDVGGKTADVDPSKASSFFADARLASFISGLLMCADATELSTGKNDPRTALLEAWSVGMLSSSLPWRMICAFTVSGILNACPAALLSVVESIPTLARFYARLPTTVARRIWAERAASPVCSRYTQSMIELLCSVKCSVNAFEMPRDFLKDWTTVNADAATPLPLSEKVVSDTKPSYFGWEAEECFISSDECFEILTGTVKIHSVEWKTPSRSAVRTLMDGGDGPPMLSEGCLVMRGLDWAESAATDEEDGKSAYDKEKEERDAQKRALESHSDELEEKIEDPTDAEGAPVSSAQDESATNIVDPAEDSKISTTADSKVSANAPKKTHKRTPAPKLPLGTVLSIEPWNGVAGMARRVRWHRTGREGVYRYGGDGGRYDISHVEVKSKSTRVRKRHPLPESLEQCAARHGFGLEHEHSVLLRLRRKGSSKAGDKCVRLGILEWPDFGAGIRVECICHEGGSMKLKEVELLFGSKDSGWESRFGQPSYVPGTTFVLNAESTPNDPFGQAFLDARSSHMSLYETLRGDTIFEVADLRNRDDGGRIAVRSELSLLRCRTSSGQNLDKPLPALNHIPPPPLTFDKTCHASSLAVSRDGRTVSCISSDGRGTAFGSFGFTKGVHYWEVKLEQADIGSVFIGVAEKPLENGLGSSTSFDTPRLNRWHGWGFVNFRATYTAGAERIYGAHCHAGDTVGVLLDCDAGRLSFFFDGLKYGEHILNDLGCAFENLSPFGFNVDGCGSGGFGQGAPSAVDAGRVGRYPAQGAVRPKALWPVIGLRNQGDRVTLSPKWSSNYGPDSVSVMKNIMRVDELFDAYTLCGKNSLSTSGEPVFPKWFVEEAFTEYQRWRKGTHTRTTTRGSGPFHHVGGNLNVDLDRSPLSCACASALLGLDFALLPDDRVRLKRSAGRILELAEEAIVLGSHQGRLYYRIVSQKSEGGSLSEGGGRAWCWDESEVVDGITIIGEARGCGLALPLMNRFRCFSPGGLKIVYDGGAVIRSDIEIFEGSMNLGSIPVGTILHQSDVMERRVNSCGVVRYRIKFNDLEGWISSSIRGGKEEPIVEPIEKTGEEHQGKDVKSYPTAIHCAVEWLEEWDKERRSSEKVPDEVISLQTFEELLSLGILDGRTIFESDCFIAKALGAICDHCSGGNPFDVSFDQLKSAISFGSEFASGKVSASAAAPVEMNRIAATIFSKQEEESNIPPVDALLARCALLRALNRRIKYALPWLSLKPSQEASTILGGMHGQGASIDRAGRSTNSVLLQSWIQVPSMGAKVRSLRGLVFFSLKKDFVQSLTDATTTATPLSHDEYELPREIRTVRLNRLKARRAMVGDDQAAKRKHSVFAQLQSETKNWAGAALRRGFVAKGHGGQKRAFKVKLIGEGVNDYSGPYREAFTDAMAEVLHVTNGEDGDLGVFDPTPNRTAGIGNNRGVFMFSLNGCDITHVYDHEIPLSEEETRLRECFSSLTVPRNETSREVEESLIFLGRIVGTAFRHGIPLDLPLPMEIVWKAIAEEPSSHYNERLAELDLFAHRHRNEGGSAHSLLLWQQRMLNAFVEGLSNVLPVEVLPLLSGEQLQEIFCGNPEVDVDLLQRVVEYEGYEASEDVVTYFWEALREFTNDERKAFLQFVWARNRLPMKASDFEAPFKILKDPAKKDGDQALPSASTCFFSLSLPEYSSKEVLKEKLLFAITNVTTMETDFQTNSAEIAEGYRSF